MIHCSDYIVTSEKLEEIVVLGAQTTPTTIPAKAKPVMYQQFQR